jgi:nitroreductase
MERDENEWFLRNDILLNIKMRHSIRNFLDLPVTDKDIDTLLKAANKAPSAHNRQSWKFIVVKGAKKKELADLVTASSARLPRTAAVLLRMAARSISEAPVVISVANTGDLISHGKTLFGIEEAMAHDFFRTMEIQSSAAAVENLLLAATSIDLATVWLGILFLIKDEVLQFLGEPKGEFMAVIPVGHSDKVTKGPKKQRVDALVRYLE